jgi:hypothetical protein
MIKFYLDHGRILVGDGAGTTEDAFSAWVSDRTAGLDTIMIATTRDLVAELNRRILPRTPTETLQQILDRDDGPTSAISLLRELNGPAARLFDAVQRYTDGLHVAAEHLVGPQIVGALDGQADKIIPDLTSEPSWPTLRARLLALAAENGEHPLHLQTAAAGRELHTVGDMAAVLEWRLLKPAPTDPGPLPWLAGISEALHDHHVWATYLTKRSQLVVSLATQIRDCASHNINSRYGHRRAATRPPAKSVKWRSGGPPTASTPKTRDQPEEPNAKRSRPCGNNASTGRSRVPFTNQQMRGPTSHRPDAPPLAATTTGSARTNNPNDVRTGRRCAGDSTPQSSNRGARNMRLRSMRWQDRQHTAKSGCFSTRGRCAPRRRYACPRIAAGRYRSAAGAVRSGMRMRVC